METPQFKSDEEFFAWTFKKISESISNLAKRIEQVEEGMQKIPPPGPDMVKYRIPGNKHYSNLKEIFGTIFSKIGEQEGARHDLEWRVEQKVDKVMEKKDEVMSAQSIENMIQIRISDQLEVLDQRLNKIESKLGI